MSQLLKDFLQSVAGGLIVSCQALPGEPLHGHDVMHLFAMAAMEGGAVGFRANGAADIRKLKEQFPLPVIGIVKQQYDDSPVFITPTIREVMEVVDAGADVIAVDATSLPRPRGQVFSSFLSEIRSVTTTPVMGDVATVADAEAAAAAGVDVIATTLVGYFDADSSSSKSEYAPDFEEIERIISAVAPLPVIVEGRVWEPEDARRSIEMGAHAVVVGSAITRPHLITERFVNAMRKAEHRADLRR